MGDMTLPRPDIGQCHCCRSPERDRLDEMLLTGRSPWAVEQELSGSGLTSRNIREHWSRGHVPIPWKAASDRAKVEAPPSLAAAVTAIVQPLSAHLGLASSIVSDVSRRVASGDLQPTVRDGLAAADLLARAEEASPTTTAEEWQAVIIIMIDSLREAMSYEQWMEFTTRLSKDPRLKAILAMEEARRMGGVA